MKLYKLDTGNLRLETTLFEDWTGYSTVTLTISILNGSTYTKVLTEGSLTDDDYIITPTFFSLTEFPEGLWEIKLTITYSANSNVTTDKLCYFQDTTIFCQIAELEDMELSIKLQMPYFFLANAHICQCGCDTTTNDPCDNFEKYLTYIQNELSKQSC